MSPRHTLERTWRWQKWWIWRVLILHLSLKTRTRCYSIMVRVSEECLSHSIHRTQWHSPDFHCFLPWNLGSLEGSANGGAPPCDRAHLIAEAKVSDIFSGLPPKGEKTSSPLTLNIHCGWILSFLTSETGSPLKLSYSNGLSKESCSYTVLLSILNNCADYYHVSLWIHSMLMVSSGLASCGYHQCSLWLWSSQWVHINISSSFSFFPLPDERNSVFVKTTWQKCT